MSRLLEKLRNVPAFVSASILAFVVAGPASAEPPPVLDTSAVTAFIEGDVTTGIAAVGVAIITLAALAMGFKWIKGAIFG